MRNSNKRKIFLSFRDFELTTGRSFKTVGASLQRLILKNYLDKEKTNGDIVQGNGKNSGVTESNSYILTPRFKAKFSQNIPETYIPDFADLAGASEGIASQRSLNLTGLQLINFLNGNIGEKLSFAQVSKQTGLSCQTVKSKLIKINDYVDLTWWNSRPIRFRLNKEISSEVLEKIEKDMDVSKIKPKREKRIQRERNRFNFMKMNTIKK